MATTSGLVQRLTVVSETLACAWIGPTPDNAEVLTVDNDGSAGDSAFAANLVQTLGAAATNYRIVTASHADDGAKITLLTVDPV